LSSYSSLTSTHELDVSLSIEVAEVSFTIKLAPGQVADALASAWQQFFCASRPGLPAVHFRSDGRPVPLGVRKMPVVRGDQIAGAGFEATQTAQGVAIVGANERFGIESVVKLMLSVALLRRNRLLVHGVAVADGAAGAVLLGESGAGKSTLGQLAAQAGMLRLADELVVLGGDGLAHGTPWNTGLAVSAPVELLGTLGWSDVERLEPIAPADFLPMLLSNTLLPDDLPATRAAVFQIATRLLQNTPPERFYFSPTPAAPAFLRATLLSRADPSQRPRGG